jgi:hypothetical protein
LEDLAWKKMMPIKMTKLLPRNDAIVIFVWLPGASSDITSSRYKTHRRGAVCFALECLINEDYNLTEIEMRKTVLTILAASLIAASTIQIAAAAAHHTHKVERAHVPASEQFRNANDSLAWPSAAAQQYWSDYSEGHVISAPAGQ